VAHLSGQQVYFLGIDLCLGAKLNPANLNTDLLVDAGTNFYLALSMHEVEKSTREHLWGHLLPRLHPHVFRVKLAGLLSVLSLKQVIGELLLQWPDKKEVLFEQFGNLWGCLAGNRGLLPQ